MKQFRILLSILVLQWLSVSLLYSLTNDGLYTKDGITYQCHKETVTLGNRTYRIAWVEFCKTNSSSIYIPATFYNETDQKYYCVRVVDGMVFKDNTNLKTISLPRTLLSIGLSAFDGCTNLTSVTFRDDLPVKSSFQLLKRAFKDCKSLKSICFPSGLFRIGEEAFMNCSSLESVNDFCDDTKAELKLKTIENSAFYGCSKLNFYSLLIYLETIGYHAFAYCKSLKNFIIWNKVTSIGTGAFMYCTSLEKVLYYHTALTVLEHMTFYNCTSLSTICYYYGSAGIIPDNIITIQNFVFYNCKNLKHVIFGKGSKLKTIGTSAFENCETLKLVELPATLNLSNGISDKAFSNCSKLSYVVVRGSNTTPYTITNTTFTSNSVGGATKATLMLPNNSTQLKNYKAAEGWKNFKNFLTMPYLECQ